MQSKKPYTDILTVQKKHCLPKTPGVYFFLDAKKSILYIGKATSLCNRVKSYFSGDVGSTRGPKIVLMLKQVRFVAYQKTDSVLEALLLETQLIKTYQPTYNTDAKDDKSYNHIVITDELFPCVLIVRGRDINQQKTVNNQQITKNSQQITENKEQKTRNRKQQRYKYIFGPFPAGSALREALKIIRKLFPFRDRCVPLEELSLLQKKKPRACFSAQIGLCPGVCIGVVSAREYGRTIHHIRLFLEGHKQVLFKQLEREMQTAVKQLHFEYAGEIKKTLFSLRHIQDVALLKAENPSVANVQQSMRIEAYDVAHLGGTASVGVMVVIQDGAPKKTEYKKFILRGNHQGDDLTALAEIFKRRLAHTEWLLPDIIVVDGGTSQRNVAQQSFAHLDVKRPICIVGVVKNDKHTPERIIGERELIQRFKQAILLANNEAHRFAITFHRARRNKEFL